jgi:hypothetical protein
MLFVIGLLVMIFSLMGGELRDATYTSTDATVLNETITFPATNVAQTLAGSTTTHGVCNAITYIANATKTGVQLTAGNVTKVGCSVTNATALTTSAFGQNGTVHISYTYTYDDDNTATDVMNETTSALAGVSDWFPIFIVIGAMVVLILLTVIIISAIKGSGMMMGSEGGA